MRRRLLPVLVSCVVGRKAGSTGQMSPRHGRHAGHPIGSMRYHDSGGVAGSLSSIGCPTLPRNGHKFLHSDASRSMRLLAFAVRVAVVGGACRQDGKHSVTDDGFGHRACFPDLKMRRPGIDHATRDGAWPCRWRSGSDQKGRWLGIRRKHSPCENAGCRRNRFEPFIDHLDRERLLGCGNDRNHAAHGCDTFQGEPLAWLFAGRRRLLHKGRAIIGHLFGGRHRFGWHDGRLMGAGREGGLLGEQAD